MYDPFAGTGSMLYACAAFGSMVCGSDIDIRMMRGKGREYQEKVNKAGFSKSWIPFSLFSLALEGLISDSFLFSSLFIPPFLLTTPFVIKEHEKTGVMRSASQYGLQGKIMDCLGCDMTQHPWRTGGIFDAIVTDRKCPQP